MVESLKQLVLINLAYNDIVWLDVGAFSSTSLRHVDLSHNALRKLISMTFLYLPHTEHIDLSYNQVRPCRVMHRRLSLSTSKQHFPKSHKTHPLHFHSFLLSLQFSFPLFLSPPKKSSNGSGGAL